MSTTPKAWENFPSTATPITAADLIRFENKADKVNALVWLGQMAAGDNVDQMLTRGWREWTKPNAPTQPGLPAGVTEQGILETLTGLSTWTTLQRATEALTGRVWVRQIRNPGTFAWWPWREQAWNDQIIASSGGTIRLSQHWLHVGDSLTDDVVLGASQWCRLMATIDGRAHEVRGWYNQETVEIAARMGGLMYPMTVTGGSIPASGTSVVVVGQRTDQLAFGGYAALQTRTIPGWLAGRHGILRNPDNGSDMDFTPDDGVSSATAVTGVQWFEGDMTSYLGRIVTIWAGTNDRGEETPERLTGHVRAMTDRLPHGRFLVFGLFSDPNGTYTAAAAAISAAYKSAFPGNYFDPLAALTSAQAATDAGITYTAQDNADIAAGFVPTSFRSDSIHLNATGAKALAYAVNREAVARGWS
jgi:hypothetical protein